MKRWPYMALDDWKEQAVKGEAPGEVILLKSLADTEIKVLESERKIRITLSTASVDRDRDTIAVDGWNTQNYEKNPVVLWAHNYRQLPIGNAVEIIRTEDKLSAVDQFVERDMYPFADTVYQMLKAGYLHTSSVGFRHLEYAINEERRGVDFLKQELLEHSIVPVPSNPEALVEARSVLGPDVMQPLIAWCEEMLDTWHGEKGLWLSRGTLEAALREASGAISITVPAPIVEEVKQEPIEAEPVFDANEWIASVLGEDNHHHNHAPDLAAIDTEDWKEMFREVFSDGVTEAAKKRITALTGRLVD